MVETLRTSPEHTKLEHVQFMCLLMQWRLQHTSLEPENEGAVQLVQVKLNVNCGNKTPFPSASQVALMSQMRALFMSSTVDACEGADLFIDATPSFACMQHEIETIRAKVHA
jgi:hypothetical protein